MMYAEKHFAFSFKIWPIVVQTTNMQFKYYCQSGVVSKSSAFQAEDYKFKETFCLTPIPILGANPFFFSSLCCLDAHLLS